MLRKGCWKHFCATSSLTNLPLPFRARFPKFPFAKFYLDPAGIGRMKCSENARNWLGRTTLPTRENCRCFLAPPPLLNVSGKLLDALLILFSAPFHFPPLPPPFVSSSFPPPRLHLFTSLSSFLFFAPRGVTEECWSWRTADEQCARQLFFALVERCWKSVEFFPVLFSIDNIDINIDRPGIWKRARESLSRFLKMASVSWRKLKLFCLNPPLSSLRWWFKIKIKIKSCFCLKRFVKNNNPEGNDFFYRTSLLILVPQISKKSTKFAGGTNDTEAGFTKTDPRSKRNYYNRSRQKPGFTIAGCYRDGVGHQSLNFYRVFTLAVKYNFAPPGNGEAVMPNKTDLRGERERERNKNENKKFVSSEVFCYAIRARWESVV